MSKVVSYHMGEVLKALNKPELEPFKSEHFSNKLLQDYLGLAQYFEPMCFFDRGNVVPHFLNFKNLYPLPAFDPSFNKSFEQVVMERAQKLIEEGRPIDVFWSGGIDSTVALISLLKCNIPMDKLRVYLTNTSIFEYGWFYYNVIEKLGITAIVGSTGDVRRMMDLNSNSLVVTGEFGDQMYGSMLVQRYFDSDVIAPYQDKVPEHVQRIVQPAIDKAHMKIETLFEWLWYMNFRFKWQHVAVRFLNTIDVSQFDVTRLRHFFDSDDFQQWAMMYSASKPKRNIFNYKQSAKDFIYEYTKDEKYYRFKKKVNSLLTMATLKEKAPALILPDGTKLRF